ncbi:MAG: Pr6Pr family membrane protein [Actinomycetota bacterium]
MSSTAKRWFGITAGILWAGLALNLTLDIFHVYPRDPSIPMDSTLLAYTDASALDRVIDFFSYFTIWSNILAAYVCTRLARGTFDDTPRNRILRADSLLMMSVTGIVYQLLLAADANLQGLQYVTNFTEHQAGPILVVGTFLAFGPRGWLRFSTVVAALAIPIAWLLYSLARGGYMGAYPYDFLNVVKYGIGPVLMTVVQIIAFALVLGLIFLGLDRVRGRVPAAVPDEG